MKRERVPVLVTLILGVAIIGLILVSPTHALPVGMDWVRGSSMGYMEPVFVVYAEQPTYQPGDWVIFSMEYHGWISHRLVEHVDGGWITQGDGLAHTDQEVSTVSPVAKSQIVGEVLFYFRLSSALLGAMSFAILLGAAAVCRRF